MRCSAIPRWSYAASKLHGEVLTALDCGELGLPFAVLRYQAAGEVVHVGRPRGIAIADLARIAAYCLRRDTEHPGAV